MHAPQSIRSETFNRPVFPRLKNGLTSPLDCCTQEAAGPEDPTYTLPQAKYSRAVRLSASTFALQLIQNNTFTEHLIVMLLGCPINLFCRYQ